MAAAGKCPVTKELCHYTQCTDKVCQRKTVQPLNGSRVLAPHDRGQCPLRLKDQAQMNTRMQKARTGLLFSQPFFGTLALELELVEDPKCKSMWVNGRQLGFNPEWVENLPMPQLEAAFAHQVMTCAFGHHLRRGSRDSKEWNDASDHAVNHELQQAGFNLPDGSLADPQYAGMHAEAIYSRIKGVQPPPAPQPQGGQGGGTPQGSGAGKGQPGKGQPQAGGGKPDQAPGAQPGAPTPAPGGETPRQEGGTGEGATGTVEDAPGDTPGTQADAAQLAQETDRWQNAVAQAAQVARGAGKLPGCIDRAVEKVLNPKVDWREALQRYFQGRAKEDYNWSKPNRRFMQLGLYLPSLDSQKIGKIAVAIDMSGSISQDVIDQFCGELTDIRDGVRPEEILILGFDTRVRGGVVRIGPDDEIRFTRLSGGGTAFDDPPRELEKMDVVPEVLVYLTDLDSSVFPQEPSYPVLWVTTNKTRAPFGEVIEMH